MIFSGKERGVRINRGRMFIFDGKKKGHQDQASTGKPPWHKQIPGNATLKFKNHVFEFCLGSRPHCLRWCLNILKATKAFNQGKVGKPCCKKLRQRIGHCEVWLPDALIVFGSLTYFRNNLQFWHTCIVIGHTRFAWETLAPKNISRHAGGKGARGAQSQAAYRQEL